MDLVLTYTTTDNQKLTLKNLFKSHEFKDNVGYVALKDSSIPNGLFGSKHRLKSVVIPDVVTSIESWAFFNCPSLTSVVIPNGMKNIGNYAFCNCTSLPSIKIPRSVTSIGNYAFSGCTGLTSIEIPSGVTSIGGEAFSGCTGLTSIEIPSSVTSIGDFAFFNCKNLPSIKIPRSVTYIGREAFDGIATVKPQYKSNGSLRAFKAFNDYWMCRGFQYEVGKSFHQDGDIRCCRNGLHACPNPLDVFNYYCGCLRRYRFAEVELNCKLDWRGDKVAASDIKIVRELTAFDLVNIYNSMEKA